MRRIRSVLSRRRDSSFTNPVRKKKKKKGCVTDVTQSNSGDSGFPHTCRSTFHDWHCFQSVLAFLLTEISSVASLLINGGSSKPGD